MKGIPFKDHVSQMSQAMSIDRFPLAVLSRVPVNGRTNAWVRCPGDGQRNPRQKFGLAFYRGGNSLLRPGLTLLESLLSISLIGILLMFAFGDRGRPGRSVCALEFSPDGTRLVAGMLNGRSTDPDSSQGWFDTDICESVALIDTNGRKPLVLLDQRLHDGRSPETFGGRFLDVSLDGKTVAIGRTDGSVAICNADAGEVEQEFVVSSRQVESVQFLPDGQTLAALNREGVSMWNFRKAQKLKWFTEGSIYVPPALSEDDRFLVAQSISAFVVYDLGENAQGARKPIDMTTSSRKLSMRGEWVTSLAFIPGTHELAVARGWSDRVERLDDSFIPTGQVFEHASVTDITFTPDGKRMATAGIPDVRLWDLEAGTCVGRFSPPEAGHRARSVAFSPDGRWLAIGDVGGRVSLWDVTTHRRLWTQSIPGQWRPSIPRIVPISLSGLWVCLVLGLWLRTSAYKTKVSFASWRRGA